jgi:hypothetical protein
MKVRANLSLGTNDYAPEYCLKDGEERDVPLGIGSLMVARGHATDITPPKEEPPELPPAVVPTIVESAPDKPAEAAPQPVVPKAKKEK